MTNVAAIPAIALLAGAAAGVYTPVPVAAFVVCASIGWLGLSASLLPDVAQGDASTASMARAAVLASRWRWLSRLPPRLSWRWSWRWPWRWPWMPCDKTWIACLSAAAGFFGAGAALAGDATREALAPPLLAQSHASRADVVGAAGATPLVLTGRIQADAIPTEFGAAFTLAAETLHRHGGSDARVARHARDTGDVHDAGQLESGRGIGVATFGTVRISVGGAQAARASGEWRAGRRVRAIVVSSAPLPYRNIGTPDHETRLALAGIRLFGSVKSAMQVELVARASWWEEAAADVRAFVRKALARHVGRAGRSSGRAPESAAPTAPSAPVQQDRHLDIDSSAGRGAGSDVALQSAAIATAILIGDRAGLDVEVEERLQRAGTFHVIAISGGNIAILTAVVFGLLRLLAIPPRAAALVSLLAIALYALIVGSGASVARATLAAIVYLFARALDLRTPPLNLLAVVVSFILVWSPLAIVDSGFWLTCLATLAILVLTGRVSVAVSRLTGDFSRLLSGQQEPELDRVLHDPARRRAALPHGGAQRRRLHILRMAARQAGTAAIALVSATVAAEVVLLPVTAYAFSQVTVAGLLLNFVAIPAMTIVQIASLTVVALACWEPLAAFASLAGLAVDLSARAIVDSASLADLVAWSAARVPAPPLWLLLATQVCLVLAYRAHPHTWRRRVAVIGWVAAALAIVRAPVLPSFLPEPLGVPSCRLPSLPRDVTPILRATILDVGQGDAVLLRFPGARDWLVDTGGTIGHFDVGTRVVSPALWALGVRHLSTLVLTHGDRDHIGGAPAILRDFAPVEIWEGVPVEGHADLIRLEDDAARRGLRWRAVHAEEGAGWDSPPGESARGMSDRPSPRVSIRHPARPQWTRTRVRNDDSIVLDITIGDVSLILPGDIGAAVERTLGVAPRPPAIRVLKAAHHGSSTSSSAPFLDALAPQVAIVSAGRGNRHGHPASDVLARYAARGAHLFRTDRDGAIQVDTDGRALVVRTCAGRFLRLEGRG